MYVGKSGVALIFQGLTKTGSDGQVVGTGESPMGSPALSNEKVNIYLSFACFVVEMFFIY